MDEDLTVAKGSVLYVPMSRARDRLLLSHAGAPSMFLDPALLFCDVMETSESPNPNPSVGSRTSVDQCSRVIATFERVPAVARLLADAEPDLLAHFAFPELHRSRIRSTNPQERLNKEVQAPDGGRRHLPDRASVIRLVGMILAEQDDEWQDGRCYFRPESMVLIDAVTEPEEVGPALLLAS